jgi:hypothetical protein
MDIFQATGGGGASASLEQTAVSADANQAMAVGKLYVVTMGAWASDNVFSLPTTAAVGDQIGVYIVDGDDTYKLQLRTTAASNDTIENVDYDSLDWGTLSRAGEYVQFKCITADTAWAVEIDGRVVAKLGPGYIRGVGYNRPTTTTIEIETGEIEINGTLYAITSAFTTKTAASSALAANSFYTIYITNDGGTIKQEWDVWATTADDPVYNDVLDYWEHPSGGAAFRAVGVFKTDGSSLIWYLSTKVHGRNIICNSPLGDVATAKTTSGTVSLAGLVPNWAHLWETFTAIGRSSGTGQAYAFIREGTVAAAPNIGVTGDANASTSGFLRESQWMPRKSDDVYISLSASTSVDVDVIGCEMRR